ncbi:MAG TPA: hypothetical protein VNJ08_13950 [Bacteriovoracaceae bacterium]|nr:hypothetical protein [Bacteriovoracaceae bacterium]
MKNFILLISLLSASAWSDEGMDYKATLDEEPVSEQVPEEDEQREPSSEEELDELDVKIHMNGNAGSVN